jgi:eukaryotic-like serine/threonine-protein kinase
MGRHPDEALYPGQLVSGRWEVGAFVGDGNFSLVFECRDRLDSMDRAIKFLSLTRNSAENVAEFENDGELLELLAGRSNITTIFARGRHPMPLKSASGIPVTVDVPYIVLELADADLATLLLDRHRVSWHQRLTLLRQVAKGMHQMHALEVVNRDLKGENVLLIERRRDADAKLCDFGRSRDTRRPPRFGPRAYEQGRGDGRFAPPEMVWGLGDDDAETMRLGDLYLIGSIFYEFATGLGLTSIALGNPFLWRSRAAAMSASARSGDFQRNAADLQVRYGVAHDAFAQELPPAIRQEGLRLLRQLTSVQPELREPRPTGRRRALPIRWDLQWVLRRIDIMILILRTAERRGARRSRGSHR